MALRAAFAQQPLLPDELDPLYYDGPPLPPPPFVDEIGIVLGVLIAGGVLFLIGRAIYQYWHPSHMKDVSTLQKGWIFLQLCLLSGGALAILILLHAM